MTDLLHFPRRELIPSEPISSWRGLTGPASFDPASCSEVTRALHSLRLPLTIEVRATSTLVAVALINQRGSADAVERAVRSAAPDWDVGPIPPPTPPPGHYRVVGRLHRGETPAWVPVKDVATFQLDSLAPLLESVQPLAADEVMVARYLIRPASTSLLDEARAQLSGTRQINGPFDFIDQLFGTTSQAPDLEARELRPLLARLSQSCFELIGLIALAGNSEPRLVSKAKSLTAAFRRFDTGYGGLHLSGWTGTVNPTTFPLAWPHGATGLLVSASELAALWHPPSADVQVPGVQVIRRPTTVLPALPLSTGVVLGVHRQRGREVPLQLPFSDLRAGPMVVLGRTGTGKSTLIHQVLAQLLRRPERPSVVVLDPNADLVRDICGRSIPPEREGDTWLVDLGDSDAPISLPLFVPPPNVPADLHVESTFSMLKLIFADGWSATRMEDCVYGIVATLCRQPGATLLDAERLFSEPGFRRRAVSRLTDPIARGFWAEFERLSESARREMARPVFYRLRQFYRSPAVRNIVCRSDPGLDFTGLLDRGSILLVSLAGGAIAGATDVLGEMLLSRLHLALQGRLDRTGERRPTVLAVDESQRFAGASLPILLREGRKLGTSLILATQYVDAWGERLAESVLGNVGSLVTFRVGASDSRRLSASLKPFTADHLENLDRHEAIVKLQVNGSTWPAVDIRTLPVDAPIDEALVERIRLRTRREFGRGPSAIDADAEIGSADDAAWDRIDIDED